MPGHVVACGELQAGIGADVLDHWSSFPSIHHAPARTATMARNVMSSTISMSIPCRPGLRTRLRLRLAFGHLAHPAAISLDDRHYLLHGFAFGVSVLEVLIDNLANILLYSVHYAAHALLLVLLDRAYLSDGGGM